MPLLEELRSPVVRRVDFLRLEFNEVPPDPAEVVGFSTGDREYSFTYDGLYDTSLTYAPAKLGPVSDVRHNSGMQSEPINISITPFDPGILERFGQGYLHYARIAVFTGFVTDTHELIEDAIILRFWGYLSSIQTTIKHQGRELNISAENRLIEGRRRYGIIAEGAHQKRRYTGDTFADLVPSMAEKEIVWGGISGTGSNYPGGPLAPLRVHTRNR